MVSPYITWEKVDNANLGFDLTLLNNRLTITADIYQRTTKDMIARLKQFLILAVLLLTNVLK